MMSPLGVCLHFHPFICRAPVTRIRRIEVKGRRRGQTIRLTTNERYKAVQLADSCWLYVVLDSLESTGAEPLRIRNPAKHLDYAKREVGAARYFDIPPDAIERAACGKEGLL